MSGCSLNTWKKREPVVKKSQTEGKEFCRSSSVGVSSPEPDLDEFGEGLVDEDEWDEESKDLLGERWDVANHEASLGRHDHQNDDDEPEPDPHSTGQVLKVLSLTKLKGNFIEKYEVPEVFLSKTRTTAVSVEPVSDLVIGFFKHQ